LKKLSFSFFLFTSVIQLGFAQRETDPFQTGYSGFDERFHSTTKVVLLCKWCRRTVWLFQELNFWLAKNDTIIFHQAYGTHNYENTSACRMNEFYTDLASC